jgi:transglutaminase-like putative cysteine protease
MLEAVVVAIGLGFFGVLAVTSVQNAPQPIVLSLDPSLDGATEAWSGVYVGDQKIGYSVHRSAPQEGGGLLLSERTNLRLVLLGQSNDLHLATDVVIDADGTLVSLVAQVRTEVQGLPVTLRAEGRRAGRGLDIDVFQAGAKLTTMHLDDVPAVPATLYRAVIARNPEPGDRITIPFFSPLTLSNAEATVEVIEHGEATFPDGTPTGAYRLRVDNSGQLLEVLVADDGTRLEEHEVEGGLGMRIVAETRVDALEKGWPDSGDAVDLIALSSVPLDRRLPGGGRSLRRLVLKVDGPEAVDRLLARFHPEGWDLERRHLLLEVPDPANSSSYTLPAVERSLSYWTRSTTFAPADHPEIIRTAGEILADDLDARSASRKLNSWVFANIKKVPVAGIPSALEVLASRRGDCNEHTTLYTALARSVGIPTRVAAGVVYSESIYEDGAFYYHAWPEVWLGDEWVPVDPTFGQFPADATHLKLVEGELDQQMELMAVIGRLSLSVVDASEP